jgi:hypothetical protein
MPTVLLLDFKQIRRNVFRAGAGCVKISRRAREVHATAEKSFAKMVRSSGFGVQG